jgi:HlyD family secretion protein
MRRIFMIACAALIAAGATWYAWPSKSSQRFHIITAKAQRGTVAVKATATGSVSALVTVLVGSQVSGRLQSIAVDFNSVVKTGDTLAVIDPSLLQTSLEQSQASVESARSNIIRAEAQARASERALKRLRGISAGGIVSDSTLEAAEAAAEIDQAQIVTAKASLAQALASLHQAQVNLDYTKILSPIDGVVVSRSVDVGQTVAASLQAPTLFTLAGDLRKMQVDSSIDEADVGKILPGMAASFTVAAYPAERFSGKVRQVRNASQVNQGIVTYDAVIDVENPELKLRPGMTANITFICAKVDDTVRIPNAALRFKPSSELLREKEWPGESPEPTPAESREEHGPSDKRTVWTLRDGHYLRVPVRIGLTDGAVTAIIEGLKEGDEVVSDAINEADASSKAQPSGSSQGSPFRRLL